MIFPEKKENLANGFSLMELVVMIALLGIVFFATVPRLDIFVTKGKKNDIAQWIMFKCRALKYRAMEEKKTLYLNIDLLEGVMFITDENMNEEAEISARENGKVMPEALRITDVEFPVTGAVDTGIAKIAFYPRGYSDKVLLHAKDTDYNDYTFRIEPFLPTVEMKEGYLGFDG